MTLEETLTPLAADLATIQDHIDKLRLEEARIKEQIRSLVKNAPDTYQAGALVVVVQANRRFSAELAAKAIPADILPLVSKPTIDAAKVKALNEVTPRDWFNDCFQDYQAIVKLR